MRFKFLALLTILSLMFLSCSSTKQSSDNNHKNLSQKEKLQEADLFAQGAIQKEAGNYAKALELFTKALDIDPDDPAALYEKARLLSAAGQTTEAYALIKHAVTIDPKNRWYKSVYANIARQEEKYDEYVKAYEELVQQYPDDLPF